MVALKLQLSPAMFVPDSPLSRQQQSRKNAEKWWADRSAPQQGCQAEPVPVANLPQTRRLDSAHPGLVFVKKNVLTSADLARVLKTRGKNSSFHGFEAGGAGVGKDRLPVASHHAQPTFV